MWLFELWLFWSKRHGWASACLSLKPIRITEIPHHNRDSASPIHRQSFVRNPQIWPEAPLSHYQVGTPPSSFPPCSVCQLLKTVRAEATREDMREAKLPLAYRDSCANLLIPLNRCRSDTYYLPWKCGVRQIQASSQRIGLEALPPPPSRGTNCGPTGRATQLREVPI
jgi:hypothetical protein